MPDPAAAAAGRPRGRSGGGGGGRGQATGAPDAAYAIGNDGYVRALNVQSGWDMFPPVQFLPANTRPAGAIVVNDETTGFSMRSRRTAAPTRRTPSGPSI